MSASPTGRKKNKPTNSSVVLLRNPGRSSRVGAHAATGSCFSNPSIHSVRRVFPSTAGSQPFRSSPSARGDVWLPFRALPLTDITSRCFYPLARPSPYSRLRSIHRLRPQALDSAKVVLSFASSLLRPVRQSPRAPFRFTLGYSKRSLSCDGPRHLPSLPWLPSSHADHRLRRQTDFL